MQYYFLTWASSSLFSLTFLFVYFLRMHHSNCTYIVCFVFTYTVTLLNFSLWLHLICTNYAVHAVIYQYLHIYINVSLHSIYIAHLHYPHLISFIDSACSYHRIHTASAQLKSNFSYIAPFKTNQWNSLHFDWKIYRT